VRCGGWGHQRDILSDHWRHAAVVGAMSKDYFHDLVDIGELSLDGRPIGRAQLLRCEYDYATEIGLNLLPYALRRLATALTETEKQREKLRRQHQKLTEATV
jgi:hypothetical protein